MWEASVTVRSEARCIGVYPTARLNAWTEEGHVRYVHIIVCEMR